MKHNIKITLLLIGMFILTQLIGLLVINHYLQDGNTLPFGLQPPEVTEENYALGGSLLISFIISFVIAIFLVFLLMNLKSIWFLRAWFFLVIVMALGISLNVISSKLAIPYGFYIVLAISIILAYFKIFKRNILVHNITELVIYPGIAAIFVPILNIWTIIILLIIISIYDIWAVWHSGVMQKMAKFQIDKIKVFSGFFVPYAPKAIREKIKLLRIKYKNKKEIPQKEIKKNKIKVNLAILGGGDIVFPMIAAGVFLKAFNSIIPALCVIIGATLALLYLFTIAKKKKFYPAMPYLTAGIFFGMLIGYVLTLI